MSQSTTASHAATPSGRPERPARESLFAVFGGAVWTGLKRAFFGLVVLLLVPAAAWWWAGSEGSLATALRWATESGPASNQSAPALEASGVTGSLRSGGRAAELTWQSEGLRVQAHDVEVKWQALALLTRTLNVQRLSVARLEVAPIQRADAPAPTPPASLRLPLPARLRLSLADIDVSQVIWQGTTRVETGKLRGNYAYTGAEHRLELAELVWAGGTYQGRAQVGSDSPFTLSANLTGTLSAPVPAGAPAVPLNLQGAAQGVLTDMQVKADLNSPRANPGLGSGASPGQPSAAEDPQAVLKARVTPWGALPVSEAQANFRALDLALLWPKAPQTRLSGSASVQPLPAEAWRLQLDARNASPGPWDRQRLPAEQLQAAGQWQGGAAVVASLEARLGGGRLQGSGQWEARPTDAASAANAATANANPWQLRLNLTGVNAAALHSTLPAQRLSGTASLRSDGPRLDFDVALQASGAARPHAASSASTHMPSGTSGTNHPSRSSPASARTLISQIGALQLREIKARGAWITSPVSANRAARAGSLDLASLNLRTADAELQAKGQFQAGAGTSGGRGEVQLRAPGLNFSATGELRPARGDGQLTLDSHDAQRALRWLGSLPGLPLDAWQNPSARGQGRLTLAWQGGWRDPQLQAQLNVPQLDVLSEVSPSAAAPDSAVTPPRTLRLRDVQARLNGRLSQAQLSLQGRAESGARRLNLQAQAEAGAVLDTRRDTPTLLRWQGVLRQLDASAQDPALSPGTWRLALQPSVAARGTPDSLTLDAGQAVLIAPPALTGSSNRPSSSTTSVALPTQALLAWQTTRWQAGQWTTAGTLRGLPLAWAETLLGSPLGQAGLSGALRFDGQWEAVVGTKLQFKAQLARSSGDLTVQAETTDGRPARIAAGLREARLNVQSDGGAVTAQVRWDSERAGHLQADLRTQLARLTPAGETEARWMWPDDAPLSGQIKAQLPRIGVWSALAPPGWRLRGAIGADLSLQGTRSDPQLRGALEANDLALRSVVDGIELGNGRLRAQLEGTRMVINEFTLQGAGLRGAGGMLRAEGEAAWVSGQPDVRLNTRLERLRVSVRNDRLITVSGQLQALLSNGEPHINGQLNVDQARIVLPDESRPQLGDDVRVRGINGNEAASPRKAMPVKLAVQVDLGEDFLIQGRGVDTRMRGILALLGDSLNTPRLYGTLLTFNGEYRAYGQALDIEEGVLRFSGPLDNPALDILAIRPNLTQRVGVQISGTALLPRVRLYSEPELPDAEKLSWLVLGRSSASGGAEAALLQQAAIALLGSRTGTNTGGLAATFGLDELSLRAGGNGDSGTASDGAITLGKRFSRNFYAAYERSLSSAVGTLFLFYDLSQRLTLRAQAGEQAAVDLIFTVPYE